MLVVQPVDAAQLAEDPEMEEETDDGRGALIVEFLMQTILIAILRRAAVHSRASADGDFMERGIDQGSDETSRSGSICF